MSARALVFAVLVATATSFPSVGAAAVPELRSLHGSDGCWAEFTPDGVNVEGRYPVMRGVTGSQIALGFGWDRLVTVSPDGRNVYRATLVRRPAVVRPTRR